MALKNLGEIDQSRSRSSSSKSEIWGTKTMAKEGAKLDSTLISLHPTPARDGGIKFFGRANNNNAEIKQIFEKKPSKEDAYTQGLQTHVQWDPITANPRFVDNTFSRPSKRARIDEKKMHAAASIPAVMGSGTALEHLHPSDEPEKDEEEDFATAAAAAITVRPMTTEKDFHQPLIDINAAINELNYIGHLANYIEGGNRLGDAVVGVKKVQTHTNTKEEQDQKGTWLAISMAKKQQQLKQATIHFQEAANKLSEGRAVHTNYFQRIQQLHQTWLLNKSSSSSTEFIVDCGYQSVGSEWTPKSTVERPRNIEQATLVVLHPHQDTGEVVVTPPSKCSYVTMKTTVTKRSKMYHQQILHQTSMLWSTCDTFGTETNSTTSSSSSSSSSSSASSLPAVIKALSQIQHSTFVEECFDRLLKNVLGNKGQRTSGYTRLIHQDGYVVVRSGRNAIEIVVENLPECDVVLLFEMVPMVGGGSGEEEAEEDLESDFLLKVAVQLSQLCVRQSWKVPTLFQHEDGGGGGGSSSSSSSSSSSGGIDVMYSIVETCRHFLSTAKRFENVSKKYKDMVAVCNNVKCGNHVTHGLDDL